MLPSTSFSRVSASKLVRLLSTTAATTTSPSVLRRGGLDVHIVPMFDDNYAYLLSNPTSKRFTAVDPADHDAVIQYTDSVFGPDASLDSILITHRHWDHAGGNKPLVQHFGGGVEVIAPAAGPEIDCVTQVVAHGDTVSVLDGVQVTTLGVPCHTVEHVAFSLPALNILFPGDTLFVAGCGRFFEGDGRDMLKAMDLLATLPDETEVFCGHEYTLSNFAFASFIDPSNDALHDAHNAAQAARAAGRPTIPTTIGAEKAYNPFMRVRDPDVAESVLPGVYRPNPEETMTVLRQMKDNF